MEDLVESLTRGNVTEVKVVLASVVLALACCQLAQGGRGHLVTAKFGSTSAAELEAREEQQGR